MLEIDEIPFIDSNDLSLKSKGLLISIVILSENGSKLVSLKEIQNNVSDGNKSVRSAINEILHTDYLDKIIIRNKQKNRIIAVKYQVYQGSNRAYSEIYEHFENESILKSEVF